MRNVYDFSLGQIELAALSERAPAEILHACRLLHRYLTEREQGLRTYEVGKEREKIKVCRSTSIGAMPQRKVRSLDAKLLDTCVVVQV